MCLTGSLPGDPQAILTRQFAPGMGPPALSAQLLSAQGVSRPMPVARQSTGIPQLDEHLGGGLLPGALTLVIGATGIGKTQLGVQFAQAGGSGEGCQGIFVDMSTRGDSQSHVDYARRLFGWELSEADSDQPPQLENFFDPQPSPDELLQVFNYPGKRVSRREMDWGELGHWQQQINEKLATTIGFLYGNFVSGCRRVVIDGVEPVDVPAESIQIELFEYIYHQVIRKDPLWVARDLFRQDYRRNSQAAEQHVYSNDAIGCMLLQTSKEAMLEQLISRNLDEGDLVSGANTVIYMGKILDGTRIRRAMYIAKHRGSAASDELIPYHIDDSGIQIVL